MRKYFIPLIIITVFALYVTTPASNSGKEGDPDFSHKLHVVDEEIECLTCHQQAESSITGKDNLLPAWEVCGDCHDEGDVVKPEVFPTVEEYSSKFSHKLHLASDLDCETCHGSVKEKTTVGEYVLPNMLECMNCHQTKAVSKTVASNECMTCHLSSDQLMPASHTPNFIHNHADLARAETKEISANMDCASCHQPRFCQDCHEGDNLDRITHPLNYQFLHALDARAKERECAVCHTERSFCIECHNNNQLVPYNHKSGWSNQMDGGRHRTEALNDIETCMACHEQNAELTCQPCHTPK